MYVFSGLASSGLYSARRITPLIVSARLRITTMFLRGYMRVMTLRSRMIGLGRKGAFFRALLMTLDYGRAIC